ncbi:MAG: CAP domain-containing protein [Cyanobium sp.]
MNYTVGGTARLGSDYQGIAASPFIKSVSFSAGSAKATVTINPIADKTVESPESVTLTLAASATYTMSGPSSVTGTIRNSPTLHGRFSKRGETITYPVDVVTGSILRASLTSSHPSLFPSIELRSLDGKLIKRAISQVEKSADLGMVDTLTGKAMLHVRSQSGATGPYILNVSVQSREDIKNEVFNLTNRERRKAGRNPLTRNSLLEKAAETHVNDMDASNRYLKHTGSKGSRPIDRIRASGYKPAWVDLGKGFFRTIPIENAASGQSSPAEVVKAWMNSPPHRAAILDPATRDMGIGFDYDQQTGSTYWVQNFGYPWTPGMKAWR